MTTTLRAGAVYSIGQPHTPSFADPLGLMSHCHRKIEAYLRGIVAAGEMLRGGRGADLAEAFSLVDAARDHFALRGPKHTEDEEVSLFPRMRECGGREAEDALSALSELEAEHRAAERAHADFEALLERLPRDGTAPPKDLTCYEELAAALSELYRPHIRVEDDLIFPTARRVLAPSALSAIGEEMRERRRDILQGVAQGAARGGGLFLKGVDKSGRPAL